MLWHKVAMSIYALDEKSSELQFLASEISDWSSSWAGVGAWKSEQNEQSLSRCEQLSSQAEALLRDI